VTHHAEQMLNFITFVVINPLRFNPGIPRLIMFLLDIYEEKWI